MKLHYVQSIFYKCFLTNPLAKLIKVHQTTTGWVGIFECLTTKKQYLMNVVEVKSEKSVGIVAEAEKILNEN